MKCILFLFLLPAFWNSAETLVTISIVNDTLQLSELVLFKCETNSSGSHFKWISEDGSTTYIDLGQGNVSQFIIKNLTEKHLDQNVTCLYGTESSIISHSQYKEKFINIPVENQNFGEAKLEKNYVHIVLILRNVHPTPECTYQGEQLHEEDKPENRERLFRNVTLSAKILRKYFKYDTNLTITCKIGDKKLKFSVTGYPGTFQAFGVVSLIFTVPVLLIYWFWYIKIKEAETKDNEKEGPEMDDNKKEGPEMDDSKKEGPEMDDSKMKGPEMDDSTKVGEVIKIDDNDDKAVKKNVKGVTISDEMDDRKMEGPEMDESIKEGPEMDDSTKVGEVIEIDDNDDEEVNDLVPKENEKGTTDVLWFTFYIFFNHPFLSGYNLGLLNNPAVVILSAYLMEYSDLHLSYLDVKTLVHIDSDYTLLFGWSLVNAVYVLSGLFGVMVAEKLASRFGRMKTFVINTILMLIATICGVFSGTSPDVSKTVSWVIFLMYRVLAGLYYGIGTYVSKFSENSINGFSETYYRSSQLSMTAGIFISSFFGLSTVFGNTDMLPCLLAINGILTLLNLLLCLVPGGPNLDSNNWKKTTDEIKVEQKLISVKDLIFRGSKLRKEVFIACLLQISQQFLGINVIIAYSSFIIHDCGVEDSAVEWIVCGTILMYLLMTPIPFYLMRKPIRTKFMLLMTVAFVMLFIINSSCQDYNPICAYFAVIAMTLYIISFSVGFGHIPYITMTRFKPNELSAAFHVSTVCSLLCNGFVMVIFLPLQKSMKSYVFLLLVLISIVITIAVHKFLPEQEFMKKKEGQRSCNKEL